MTTTDPTLLTRRRMLGLALGSLVVVACGSDDTDPAAAAESSDGAGVTVVAPDRAAEIIAENDDRLFILDVRTPQEFDEAHIAGAELIDIQAADFTDRIDGLDRDRQYVLYCRSGNRSEQARSLMADLGFVEVYDVAGGIVAWTDAGFPVVSS